MSSRTKSSARAGVVPARVRRTPKTGTRKLVRMRYSFAKVSVSRNPILRRPFPGVGEWRGRFAGVLALAGCTLACGYGINAGRPGPTGRAIRGDHHADDARPLQPP